MMAVFTNIVNCSRVRVCINLAESSITVIFEDVGLSASLYCYTDHLVNMLASAAWRNVKMMRDATAQSR